MINFGVCPMQLFFTPHPVYQDEIKINISNSNETVEGETNAKLNSEVTTTTIKLDYNLTNSEYRISHIKDLPKSTWMIRYDSNKKEFVTAFKNELLLNFPEKVILRGDYIITINSKINL